MKLNMNPFKNEKFIVVSVKKGFVVQNTATCTIVSTMYKTKELAQALADKLNA